MTRESYNMDHKEWLEKYIKKGHIYRSDIATVEESSDVINDFKKAVEGKKVVLYGAGTVGKNYIRLFNSLSIKIDGVFDKSVSKAKIKGYEVKSREIIKDFIDDNSIIIVSVNREYYDEIQDYLVGLGIEKKNIINGHDVHLVLQSSWCMIEGQKSAGKIDTTDCWECTLLNSQCTSLRKYLKKLNEYHSKAEGTTESVRMIGYILGNLCSLNCKNCCECIPYYKKENRGFVASSQVIRDIEHLSSACDFLTILEFVGGEPFLHPEIGIILKYVLSMKNVGMIHIFTNGTVTPSDEISELMANERIEIYMSNYQAALTSPLLKKRKETIDKLTSHGASIMEGKKEDWLDYRSFERMDYSSEESERNFADCFLHNCNRLYNGTLYTCPHQYAGINLGAIRPVDGVVNIYEYTQEGLAMKLEEFRSLKTIDACMHCRLPYRAETALSGEQL